MKCLYINRMQFTHFQGVDGNHTMYTLIDLDVNVDQPLKK